MSRGSSQALTLIRCALIILGSITPLIRFDEPILH